MPALAEIAGNARAMRMGKPAPWWPFYGVVGLCLMWPLLLQAWGGGTVNYGVVFVALGAVGCAVLVVNRRWVAHAGPALGTSALLAAPVALSVATHPGYWPASGGPVLGGSALLLLVALLIPYVRACGQSAPNSVDRCLIALMVASPGIALLAVIQALTGDYPILIEQVPAPGDVGRGSGVFGHPSLYGTFAACMAVVTIIRKPPLWQALVGANLAGLVASGARGAALALVVSLALYALVTKQLPRARAFAGGLAAVAVVTLVAMTFAEGQTTRVADAVTARVSKVPAAFSSRLDVQDGARERLVESPGAFLFGYGAGSATRLFTEEGYSVPGQPPTLDNTYLVVWYELGAVGLLAVLAFIAGGLRRRDRPEVMALTAFIATNLLTYDGFGPSPVYALVFLTVAVAAVGRCPDRLPKAVS